ncbi:MAG: ribosome assembly RNA-binding protein YhbY [Algicola sp.]|nr:ribosome assembly RNA-binding protein YhbY [Algicola sp.]
MSLSKKQVQHLRGLAHSLKPTVLLGNNGLTEAVLSEIELALGHHELIKVKVPSDDRDLKKQIIEAIVRETKAVKVHTIGHVLTIYKAAKEPKMVIPKI